MDALECILTRRSVRQFDSNKKITHSEIEELLKAASYAPSAHNKQPWQFLVIEDKEIIKGFRQIQPWTSFAKDASCVIIICADTEVAFHREKEDEQWSFADIDCSLAAQNLLLACHAKGFGACFCGVAPMRPLTIIPVGYPLEEPKQPDNRYNPDKVHWEKW